MNDKISPRSKGERKAYTSGYLDALVEVATNGMVFAQQWALEMVSIDNPELAKEFVEKLRKHGAE